jgi:imidazolonepropionase-like amidohydrolase
MEALVEVLERSCTVHFHCHRADDLITALRLAEEFGFELVLQHATEGYRVAEELARRKIPASLTLLDSPGGKAEAAGLLDENAAVLDRAGVLVAINTDDAITESRFFLRTGAIAVRGGMSEEAALRALTINPARMLHLEGRVGSLEPGKDADFVVLSGPPFSVYAGTGDVPQGDKVFDRARHRDWTYQAGVSPSPTPKSCPSRSRPAATRGEAPSAPKDSPTLTIAHPPGRRRQRIHTVGNGTINDGIILVEDGKVVYVGPRDELRLPANTPVLTAAVVTPGLIDAHTVVGLAGELNIPADQDQDELSDPNQADLRVIDGFNPNEPLLEFLRTQESPWSTRCRVGPM